MELFQKELQATEEKAEGLRRRLAKRSTNDHEAGEADANRNGVACAAASGATAWPQEVHVRIVE